MNATPGPSVSGKYFLPNAPLLWINRNPAACVTSRKVTPGPEGDPEAAASFPAGNISAVQTATTHNNQTNGFIPSPNSIAADAQRVRDSIDVVKPRRDQRNLQNPAIIESRAPQPHMILW